MNKNIFFTLLFVCLVSAQFDHVADQGSALNLAQTLTDTNGLHRELSATVTSQFVVGGECRQTVHAVTNVQLNNGPLNSGTYFSVTVTRTSANGTLSLSFGSPDGPYYSILQTVGGSISSSVVGVCPSSSTSCTFRYYCSIYTAETPLEVIVDTECNSASNPINFYDLSVTQYIETIQIVPTSRSLTQSSPVVRPFNANNLGPANFVHYYHDLQPTVAEAGASSRLYIEAVNWSTSTSGTAYICVSYTKMVASTSSLSQVPPFSGNIDTAPISNTDVSEPSGCTITCAAGTITGSGSVILAVPACNDGCGFKDTIWIGVVPPSTSVGSTYTVRLRFRDFSVPDLVTINATPSVGDGAVVEVCNGQEGDFGCDDYYEITYQSVGSPAVADRRLGPFLAVELFGVYNGVARLEVADGFLAGETSLCPGCTPFSACTVCDNPDTRSSCGLTDCWSVVQPCQWNTALTNDWVFTVSAVSQDDSQIPIEYGVRASIGSWPLTTVTPTAWETGQPNFGKVLVDHYSHYQVTFTDAQIFDDSYFEVELYTNYDDDVVGFAWNFNKLADDGTCYGSLGRCSTNTNCAEGTTSIGSCRFAFINCPTSVSYQDYFEGLNNDKVSGSKLSQLQAGTYYFAVWGIAPGSVSYNNAVEYTIYWNYHRALPIYDQVTYNNFVYYLDYSPQYKFIVPSDDNIYVSRFRISDTQRGGVTAYANCGELAGTCPCWSSINSCSTSTPEAGSLTYDCDIIIPTCQCPSGIIYITVTGQATSSTPFTKPVTYSITPYLTRYSDFSQRTVVHPISASRAISPIIDTISLAETFLYQTPLVATRDSSRFYKLSLNNVDLTGEDALLVTLKISPQELFGLNTPLEYLPSELEQSSLLGLAITRDYAQCDLISSCTIQANNVVPINGNMGLDSHCTITLQPCFVDEAACIADTCEQFNSVIDRSFISDSTYYISVTNFGSYYSYYLSNNYPDSEFIEAVQYTLNAQVVDQSPYVLTNGVPFFGDVGMNNYVHFSFDVSQAPADNRLVFSLYGDHDQRYPLTFFINYDSKAGRTMDCYDHSYPCYTCSLYSNAATTGSAADGEIDHCYYEITPCELSSRTGVYFVSVYNPVQTDNDQGLFTVQATYFPTIALLDATGFGVPTPGNVRQRSSAYYSVTVPTLVSGNIVGRVLSIDVEAVIKGQIYVTITKINPDNQCDCAKDGHLVTASIAGDRDDINWKRYNCELTSGEIYYISVEADQDTYCDPTGFVVHAKLQNIISIPITLAAVDSRIIGSYDSNNTSSGLVLEYNQFTALTFTTNAPAGAALSIVITEASSLFNDVLPFDVYLSIGSVYTPPGTNDDSSGFSVGPGPNRASCPALLANCFFTGVANEQCVLLLNPCEVPEGSVTWFLTFSGESLPLNRQSEVINVAIRLIASEPTINTPAISTYGPVQTTGLQFDNTINRSFGRSYFTTSSAMGINAGDRVTFAASVSGELFVSYETETSTDNDCDFTCSATGASPQCTVYACESIAAGTWYIGIEPTTTTTTATFTVTRTQVENSTISVASPSPLPLNTDTTFTSLSANEWRYHTFTVTASTSSHYELIVSGGASASNIVYVSSPVWLPYLTIRSLTNNDVTLFNSGVTGRTCGGFTAPLPQETCCYDSTTVTFAVIGSVAGYTLKVEVVEFAGNQVQSVSVPSNTTGTATLGRVNWYSFTQPAGTHLWFDFAVFTGAADLYLNSGSRAGSKASNFENGGDFGYCWGNDGLIGSSLCSNTVSAGSFCDGFVASCNPCLAANSGYTFFFAVVPAPNATFSLEVIAQTDRSIALGQNNGLEFPVPAGTLDLLDLRSSTDSFSAYAHYFYDYSRTFNSIQNFIPVRDDPAVGERLDYANLEIYIDNFRDSAGAVTASIPVRFYINYNGLAGAQSSSGCYGGRDITASGSVLPCIENTGAAFANATAIQCSINVCDLGNCGGVIYLSSSRVTSGSVASFTYDIEIIEDFNAVTEWVDIVNLQVGTGSFPFTYNGDNSTDVVYIRYTASGLSNFADATSQYILFTLTNVTGAAGTTTASFRFYDADTCSQFSSSQPICTSIDSTGTCQLLTDPCGTGDTFDKSDVAFIRVSRDSSDSGVWSFIFNAQVLTVAPIDTSITTLSPALTTTSRTSYTATKEILDFTWHFYEFFVTPSDGYSWLDVDVTELCCTAANSDLEVFYSWEQQSNFEVLDNARPNRWATDACNVFNTEAPASSNDITDLCNFWGGAYRVGIFAQRGHQLFPNPILGEVYPALYQISAQVNTMAHGVATPECPVTQVVDSSSFISRWEFIIPAENRGAQLFFGAFLNVPSAGNDVVFWASKNSNPWNRQGSGICTWDAANDGDYSCTPVTETGPVGFSGAVSQCVIAIQPCEFDDGVWYLFIQRPGLANIPGALVTIGGRLTDKKYTPTFDLRTTDTIITSGSVFFTNYQYYRLLVDPTNPLSYITAQVTDTGCRGCTYEMYLSTGPRGFAAANTGDLSGPTCVDTTTGCSPNCLCSATSDNSVIQWSTCDEPAITSYFIGLAAPASRLNCEYDLQVWGTPRKYAVLPFNVETCSIASCIEFWELADVSGNTDLTGALVSFSITNTGVDALSYSVNYNNIGSNCALVQDTCAGGSVCTISLSCITGRVFVGISGGSKLCGSCSGIEYSILTTSVSFTTFNTLSLGSVGSAGPATFVTGSQFVVANANVDFSIGTFSSLGCSAGCLRVLDLQSTYFFSNAAGLVLSDVGTVNTLSSTIQSFTLSEPYFHFSVTPAPGVDSFTIFMDNFAYCACDGGSIESLGLYVRASTISPPFDGCYDCTGGTLLTSGSCPSSMAPLTFSCVAETTYYFTISSCLAHTCDVTFSAYVEFSTPRTSIGGDHNGAFLAVSSTNVNCGGSSASSFYVEVTDILSVSIKEPHGDISGASVSVVKQGTSCTPFASCSVQNDAVGVLSSCRASNCNVYSFAEPGIYYIDVNNPLSATGDSSVVYLQVVNNWVDLSGSVSNSIIGQTRHFYRLSNAASAVSIDLTISEGPSLTLIVFDDLVGPSSSSLVAGFQETLQCSFGTCSIYIPTFAKHSLADTFYIEIDSSSIVEDAGAAFGPASQYNRAINVRTEKPTRYTLSATLSTANCAAPPSTGFCASDVEGGNVWSEINNSVWNYERPDLKDNEAFCRFSDLINQCPTPSEECRRWLKVFSCLESFPQCDGSGFQMGVCQDVCYEVTNACGQFKFLRDELNCCSDKYVAGNDSTISTCYNIPPPPPPPETFAPEPGSDISSVPPAFVVPVFTTIDVFLPEDFVRDNKAAAHVENASSASGMAFSFVLLVLLALLI